MGIARTFVRSAAATAFLLASSQAGAQLLTLSNLPLYVGANVQPLVMLTLSKDQQLYKKAYNDYSDLDNDGEFETTYKHSINYYGYFDPYKCYTYSSANKRFEPAADTSALAAANQKYCDTVSGDWSGNFLNWASMSRMDAVRKLLYGGLRSPNRTNGDGNGIADGDTSSGTVLERAYLPTDAHSWVKFYDGTDIARLTPITPDNISTTGSGSGGSNQITFSASSTGGKTIRVSSTANFAVNDIIEVALTATPTTFARGVITSISSPAINFNISAINVSGSVTNANYNTFTVRNLSRQGVSICNTTLGGASPQNRSQSNTNLPRIRVTKGNYSLWAANERWQCRWSGEVAAANSNVYGDSGIPAYSSSPALPASPAGDFFARVQVCVSGLIGTEKCKQYPTSGSAQKPIGLLQTYADPGLLRFGLMTGSYAKNVSGGVLRKNVSTMTDEINSTTDGTFKTAALAAGYAGIINTLNRMRIWGYNYDDGTYLGGSGDNCNFQLTSITENGCTSWGNPMSEIYFETLRYYAGGKPLSGTAPLPTAAYTYTNTGSKDESLGLPLPTWQDPLSQSTYCAPLNAIVFNASVSTNDDNQVPSGSSKTTLNALTAGNLTTMFSPEIGARNVVAWTDLIGASNGENIHNNSFFVGRNGTDNNEFCTAKTVTSLGTVSGICPEGPTQAGSYNIAGLAYAAHTNRIRSDFTVPTTNPGALKVDTYGVQLATNVPQLNLQLVGESTPKVVIQPTYRLFNSAPQGGGALVDLRIIPGSYSRGTTFHRGAVYLNWEDSEQGGDYDQDMWGLMSWCMQTGTDTTSCPGQGANTVSVTTRTIAQSTANPQGFGYIISGTTKDGPHFHSGILGFNYTDSQNISVTGGGTNASGGCNNCQVGAAATRATYALGTSTGAALKDPLWYAAKWGGFREQGTGGNNRPDLTAEFDQKDSSGNASPDGVPDNYFLVSNPLGLESALDKAFVAILTTSSASSVATNSTSLNTGSRIYQARFNSNDWSGQLLSFTIDLNGVIASVEEWDAGQKINLQNPTTGGFPTGRTIATMGESGTVGIDYVRAPLPFRWASLTAAQQTALNTNIASTNDGLGSARVDYLRGSAANEGLGSSNFRRRINSKLGDIVNSNPQFVGPPNAGHSDAQYQAFKTTHANRPPFIVVGANDGMLHAFDASAEADKQGRELFGYIPSNVFYKLPWLTAQNYAHRFFVDGTPVVSDVFTTVGATSGWRTVTAVTQAAGGQSISLLDVTTPRTNTEANVADWVLWEFRDSDHGGRIGNIYGFPTIAKMNNGKWAVVVSSGYNHSYACAALPCTGGDYLDSSSYPQGRANLYIIFIENGIANGGNWVEGVDFVRINTQTGSGVTPNGLASPTVVDVDGDGMVDYAYAGDLQGNMWKFDLTSSTATDWRIAFSGNSPLYRARDASNAQQPITAPAGFMTHPDGGYLILFGTGRYIQPTDPNAPYSTQTVYAIWDKQSKTNVNGSINPSAGPVTSSVTTRDSLLLQQQTTITGVTAGGIDFRVTSDNTVDYTSQRGWYWDMPGLGERMVVRPDIRNGKAILTSLEPSTTSCDAGGTGWLTDLDALTGSRLTASPFDLNNDRAFTSADLVTVIINGTPTAVAVSSRKSQVGITPAPTIIAGGQNALGQNTEFKVTSGSTGGREAILENPFGTPPGGTPATRRSWREILQN